MTKSQMQMAVGVLEQATKALAPLTQIAYPKGAELVTLTFHVSLFDAALRTLRELYTLKKTLESQLNEESAA